jgi:hypothetical protein
MAITSTKMKSSMVIKYVNGEKENGDPKLDSQKHSVKGTATDEQLYNTAVLMGKLTVNEPTEIRKLEEFSLNEA